MAMDNETVRLAHLREIDSTSTDSTANEARDAAERVLQLYRASGGPLVGWLFEEAALRGLRPKDLATELGVTYGYVMQLQTGRRSTENIGRGFATRCAEFLGIPAAAVFLLSGHIRPADFVAPGDFEQACRRRAGHLLDGGSTGLLVVADGAESVDGRFPAATGLMSEAASGTKLVSARGLGEILATLQCAALIHEENELRAADSAR